MACVASIKTIPDTIRISAVRDFRRSYEETGLCAAITRWLTSVSSEAEISTLSAGSKAKLHAWCGDDDLAFELLDRTFEEGSSAILLSRFHLAFDNLRDDPRFDELLRKAGLPKIEIPDPSSTP